MSHQIEERNLKSLFRTHSPALLTTNTSFSRSAEPRDSSEAMTWKASIEKLIKFNQKYERKS